MPGRAPSSCFLSLVSLDIDVIRQGFARFNVGCIASKYMDARIVTIAIEIVREYC